MKVALLKKNIIKATLLYVVILSILGVIAWGLTSFSAGTVEKKTKLSGEVASLDNETQALKGKLTRVEQAAPLYKQLTEGGNWNKLSLNRQDAKPLFDALQDQYQLMDMKVSFDAIQELKEEKFKKAKALGISVNVTVSFSALSDEHAMNFLADLKKQMPGIVKFTKLTISRDKDMGTIANLNFSTDKKLTSEVKVTTEFTWYGIKEPSAKPAAAALGTPPPPGGGAASPASLPPSAGK